MWAVGGASRRKEKRTGRVLCAGFLPFAGKDINGLVRFRVNVGRDPYPRVEFAEYRDTAGLLVLVQHHQLDAWVRAGLPLFIFCQRNVREHGPIESVYWQIASQRRIDTSTA